MFHNDFVAQTTGLPTSILAAAAAKASKNANVNLEELLQISLTDDKANHITAALEKIHAIYARKKLSAKARRVVCRANAKEVKLALLSEKKVDPVVCSTSVEEGLVSTVVCSVVAAAPEKQEIVNQPPSSPSHPPSSASSSSSSSSSLDEELAEGEDEDEQPPRVAIQMKKTKPSPVVRGKSKATTRWGV
jgi:hypothetical protein